MCCPLFCILSVCTYPRYNCCNIPSKLLLKHIVDIIFGGSFVATLIENNTTSHPSCLLGYHPSTDTLTGEFGGLYSFGYNNRIISLLMSTPLYVFFYLDFH